MRPSHAEVKEKWRRFDQQLPLAGCLANWGRNVEGHNVQIDRRRRRSIGAIIGNCKPMGMENWVYVSKFSAQTN